MRFLSTLSTLFTLSSISLVAAAPSDLLTTTKIIPCGNTNVKPDPTVEAALSGVVAELQRTAGKVVGLVDDVVGGLLPRQSTTKNINVYWHTIREGTTAAQGTTTSAQISASIQRLNQYLTPLGFRFTLASTDVTTNADWFNNAGPDTPQQTAMKNALRKGAARDLNVYTVAYNSGEVQGLLGYATFPWSYSGAPKDDGVSMNYRAMPSGSLNGYNVNAGTLVHETGHWLGLYHTFQGGCSDTAGDYVSDTAAESEPHFSCSSSSDSCPNLPGADPLSNFMSYTPDNCKTLFTSGQGQRAIAACQTYRGL